MKKIIDILSPGDLKYIKFWGLLQVVWVTGIRLLFPPPLFWILSLGFVWLYLESAKGDEGKPAIRRKNEDNI